MISPGDHLAIGDIHGRIDILKPLVDGLRDIDAHVIFLGDLIDRAKNAQDDLDVITLVKTMTERPEEFGLRSVTCLRGNHEQMLLDAIRDSTVRKERISLWAHNGGAVSMLPQLREFEGWLADLPLHLLLGRTLLVHAGVRPGVPLADQHSDDLVWIRKPFLDRGAELEEVDLVVHGHTPNLDGHPVVRPGRICIDTGAFATGVLTIYNVNTGSIMQVGEGLIL